MNKEPTYSCPGCNSVGYVKNMDIKMGGLLCEGCRRIIFAPYVDEIYFIELRRRRAESEKKIV